MPTRPFVTSIRCTHVSGILNAGVGRGVLTRVEAGFLFRHSPGLATASSNVQATQEQGKTKKLVDFHDVGICRVVDLSDFNRQ